jgi:hypothetical protein
VVIGLSGASETAPALLIVRTVWWWTIGKMWAETNVLPRALGLITAVLAIAFPAAAGAAALAGRSDLLPDLALRLVFAAWLVVLAAFLWPRRPIT